MARLSWRKEKRPTGKNKLCWYDAGTQELWFDGKKMATVIRLHRGEWWWYVTQDNSFEEVESHDHINVDEAKAECKSYIKKIIEQLGDK